LSDVLAGGVVVAAASLLSGTTGFGYGLVATPLLLLTGFSLPFVVAANLAVSFVMRGTVAYRFRREVDRRRTALLIAGSLPGLYLGARVLRIHHTAALEAAIGALVMVLAAWLAVRRRVGGEVRPRPALSLGAGLAGGFLGTLSSLSGVAPVLLLTRERARPVSYIADLAVYFVATSALGLATLLATGSLQAGDLSPDVFVWLPVALAGNAAGLALAPRVREDVFRTVVLAVVFVAGAMTVAGVR
jgi:uncharacterized membrane protein YfcA